MKKPIKRLYRSRNNQIIGGGCAGIADYFEVDPVLVRLIWVIATLFSMGLGILAYIIAWIIIPEEPKAAKQKH